MSQSQKPKLNERLAAIRRRRRLVSLRRLVFIIAAIIFVILLFTGFFAPLFNSAAGAVDSIRLVIDRGDGFPEQLLLPGVSGASPLGQGAVVSGENDLVFISPSAKQIRRLGHSYDNPLLESADDRVLIYTRGAQDLRIEGFYETILVDNIGLDIFLADIANNGVYALATADPQYRSSVNIYSTVGTEIFNYKLADEMPIVMTFSDNSRYICFATIYSKDGVLLSNIYTFSVQSRELISVIEGIEGVCLDLAFQGSNKLLAVYEDKAQLFDLNESQSVALYDFDDRQLLDMSIAQDGEGLTLLLGELQLPSSVTLMSFDDSLEMKGQTIIPFTVDNIFHSEYNIFVSSGSTLYSYDLALQLAPELTAFDEDIISLLPNGLCVGSEYIYEY